MELLEEPTVAVRLISGRAEDCHSLFYDNRLAAQAWPPLVSLRPAHRAKGSATSLGLPDYGWFVTFMPDHRRHHDIRSVRRRPIHRNGGAVHAGGWVVAWGRTITCSSENHHREQRRTPDDD